MKQDEPMRRSALFVLALFGSAIVALVAGVILAGIGQSGVVNMQLTHALFWIALAISSIAVMLWAWLVSQSLKYSLLALVGTVILVGGGLWRLNSWLVVTKTEQDAASQPPKQIYKSPPTPSIATTKTPKPKPPQVKIVQHGTGNGVVGGNVTQGPCSTLQIGGTGNTATTNCGPQLPPERTLRPGDETALVSALSQHQGKVTIGALGTDSSSEPYKFAQKLQHVFHAAGWTFVEQGIAPSFSSQAWTGITVEAEGNPKTPIPASTVFVIRALQGAHIKPIRPIAHPEFTDDTFVLIVVGNTPGN